VGRCRTNPARWLDLPGKPGSSHRRSRRTASGHARRLERRSYSSGSAWKPRLRHIPEA
jgi:hypothetical protein